jgi:hypothetical protein
MRPEIEKEKIPVTFTYIQLEIGCILYYTKRKSLSNDFPSEEMWLVFDQKLRFHQAHHNGN